MAKGLIKAAGSALRAPALTKSDRVLCERVAIISHAQKLSAARKARIKKVILRVGKPAV